MNFLKIIEKMTFNKIWRIKSVSYYMTYLIVCTKRIKLFVHVSSDLYSLYVNYDVQLIVQEQTTVLDLLCFYSRDWMEKEILLRGKLFSFNKQDFQKYWKLDINWNLNTITSVISSDSSFIAWHVLFTTVPLTVRHLF